MFLKKTVVLSGKSEQKEKAVLTLSQTEEGFEGTLKLYHFEKEPSGILSLGFLPQDGKVTKCGLSKKGVMIWSFALEQPISLSSFSVALIQLTQGKATPLLLGTHNKSESASLEEKLAFAPSLLEEQPTMQRAAEVLDERNLRLEDEEETTAQIESELKRTEPNSCVNCPYRQCFFESDPNEAVSNRVTNFSATQSTATAQTPTLEEGRVRVQVPNEMKPKPKQQELEEETFLSQIQAELNELFASYPREDKLERIVPNSKWVKVNLDNDDEHYVVGTIENEGKLKYICYGIPGMFGGKPPKQIEKFAQWLPLDPNQPNENGYWMTYQEATSGESIRIIVS